MGHYSVQVNIDIYDHLVPGGSRVGVKELNDSPGHSFPTSIRNLSVILEQKEL